MTDYIKAANINPGPKGPILIQFKSNQGENESDQGENQSDQGKNQLDHGENQPDQGRKSINY